MNEQRVIIKVNEEEPYSNEKMSDNAFIMKRMKKVIELREQYAKKTMLYDDDGEEVKKAYQKMETAICNVIIAEANNMHRLI